MKRCRSKKSVKKSNKKLVEKLLKRSNKFGATNYNINNFIEELEEIFEKNDLNELKKYRDYKYIEGDTINCKEMYYLKGGEVKSTEKKIVLFEKNIDDIIFRVSKYNDEVNDNTCIYNKTSDLKKNPDIGLVNFYKHDVLYEGKISYKSNTDNSINTDNPAADEVVEYIDNEKKIHKNRQIYTTYRFGTPSDKEDIISHIVNKLKNNYAVNKKPKIVITLLGGCNTFVCNTYSMFNKKINIEEKIKNRLVNFQINRQINDEDIINDSDMIQFIFIPLRNRVKYGFTIYDRDNFVEKDKSNIKNSPEYYKYINSNIIYNDDRYKDLSEEEEIFRKIVDISYYHFQNKDNFDLFYHCRSGKDRTSIFDAINKSSIYYFIKNHKKLSKENYLNSKDYDKIRENTSRFIIIGLIIAAISFNEFGLNVDSIGIAKHVLGNNFDYIKRIKHFRNKIGN